MKEKGILYFKYKMAHDPKTCIQCKKQTVSVISTPLGPVCYQCFSENKNPPNKGKKHDKAEERMQIEFFNQVPVFFPSLPSKLLFAVPNGGSRNIIEATNLKRQGVKTGVSDVILLISKKGFSCLCLEFKTETGRQSDEQIEFQWQVESFRGKYVVVRSVKQAIDIMMWYPK